VSANLQAVSAATSTTRRTAEERRETVLEAARAEFAVTGYHGTSTDAIAERAGISQPYLFRLYGTKKELFLACIERGFSVTLEGFKEASDGLSGEQALEAMGRAYMDLLADRTKLLAQMQSYAACDDPEVREAVRRGFRDLYSFVDARAGVSSQRLAQFFAKGMLINVIAAMDLGSSQARWAKQLIEGARQA
jgi:AcrR family transcriptional regulator